MADEHNAANDLELIKQLIVEQLVIEHDQLDYLEHDNKHDDDAMRFILYLYMEWRNMGAYLQPVRRRMLLRISSI